MSTDFLTEIPTTDTGFDAVLVIVDKLSKREIFQAVRKTDKAKDEAQIFQGRLFSIHDFPNKIISDRDPQFTSFFWKSLAQLLNIKSKNLLLTTHRRTDSLKTWLEQYPICYVV